MSDIHNDKELFIEAINVTADQYNFSHNLIEKDYYLSLFLNRLYAASNELIFKGGTCLNKIYAGFYRLSEDLDFMIDCNNSTRSLRREQADLIRNTISNIANEPFSLSKEISGHSLSRQYIGEILYLSVFGGYGKIKIEISLREPLLLPANISKGNCLLINPITLGNETFDEKIRCYSKEEAYAEKIRALFTRKNIASRDIYDIYYALKTGIISINKKIIHSAKIKISKNDNSNIHTPYNIISMMKKNMDGELKPVLRESDYSQFNIEEAENIVSEIYKMIS